MQPNLRKKLQIIQSLKSEVFKLVAPSEIQRCETVLKISLSQRNNHLTGDCFIFQYSYLALLSSVNRCWNNGQQMNCLIFSESNKFIRFWENSWFFPLRLLSTKTRCLRENSSFVHYFYRNRRKIYVILKFISIVLTVFVFACAQRGLFKNTKLTVFTSLNYEPLRYHAPSNKLDSIIQ